LVEPCIQDPEEALLPVTCTSTCLIIT
jgi:hypothetical protein